MGSIYVEEAEDIDRIGTRIDRTALDAIDGRCCFTGRVRFLVSVRHIDAELRHRLWSHRETTAENAEEQCMTRLLKVETVVDMGSRAESQIAVQAHVDSLVLFLQRRE